jgi:hypothetical protein
LRATQPHFCIRLTYRYRLLLAALLVLVAVVGLRLATAAQAAKTLHTSSPHPQRRSRLRTWQAATRFPRPRFRPTRTISVHTARQFWRAWDRLRPGDEIDVHGRLTFSDTAVFRKQLPGWAEVHFSPGTRFTGTPGNNEAAALVDHCQHIRFYGGNLTNPSGGSGITIYDSSSVTWQNFVIHDTANTGLFVQGIHQRNTHLDLKGEIYHWGMNLGLDPHSEKGTGLHGAYLGESPYGVSDSRFALNVHDGATGAGIEMGGRSDYIAHNTLYLWCRDLTKIATKLTAGNCAQLWGVNVTDNVFKYIKAENLTGRPFQTGGMYAGQSLKTDRVDYGRAIHTNLNSLIGSIRWDRRFNAVFRNVSPSP